MDSCRTNPFQYQEDETSRVNRRLSKYGGAPWILGWGIEWYLKYVVEYPIANHLTGTTTCPLLAHNLWTK